MTTTSLRLGKFPHLNITFNHSASVSCVAWVLLSVLERSQFIGIIPLFRPPTPAPLPWLDRHVLTRVKLFSVGFAEISTGYLKHGFHSLQSTFPHTSVCLLRCCTPRPFFHRIMDARYQDHDNVIIRSLLSLWICGKRSWTLYHLQKMWHESSHSLAHR